MLLKIVIIHIHFLTLFHLTFNQNISLKELIQQNPACRTCKQGESECKKHCPILKNLCTNESVAKPLSKNEQKRIEDIHNNIRYAVSIGYIGKYRAGNMNILSYNEELAFYAQCWANACILSSDPCNKTETFEEISDIVKYVPLGGFSNMSIVKITDIIDSLEEDLIMDYKQQPDNISEVVQMIWAQTMFLGCGRTYFKNKIILVCKYSPPGCITNDSIYQIGNACSLCYKKLCNEDFPALCGEKSYIKFKPPLSSDAVGFKTFFFVTYFIHLLKLTF